jgi:hypothetical protein
VVSPQCAVSVEAVESINAELRQAGGARPFNYL